MLLTSEKHDWSLVGCNETKRQPPGPPPIVTRDGTVRLDRSKSLPPPRHEDLESDDSPILVVLFAIITASGLLVSRQRAGRRFIIRLQARLTRWRFRLGMPSSSTLPLSFGSGGDYSFDFQPPGSYAISTAVEPRTPAIGTARSCVNRRSRTTQGSREAVPYSVAPMDPLVPIPLGNDSSAAPSEEAAQLASIDRSRSYDETDDKAIRRLRSRLSGARNRGMLQNRHERIIIPRVSTDAPLSMACWESADADSTGTEVSLLLSTSWQCRVLSCFDKLTQWHREDSMVTRLLVTEAGFSRRRQSRLPFLYETAKSMARKESRWTSSQIRIRPDGENIWNHNLSVEIYQIHYPIPLPPTLASQMLVLRHTRLVKEAWQNGELPCLVGERTLGHDLEKFYFSVARKAPESRPLSLGIWWSIQFEKFQKYGKSSLLCRLDLPSPRSLHGSQVHTDEATEEQLGITNALGWK